MKIAILGDLFLTNEVLEEALREAFKDADTTFECVYQTDHWPIAPVMATDEVREFVGDENEVIKVIGDVEMAITHTAPITQKVIDAAPKLRVVGAARGGPVNINWTACTSRGIPVLYAPGRNSGAAAEYTVGMMLAQSRNITRSHMSLMTSKRWRGRSVRPPGGGQRAQLSRGGVGGPGGDWGKGRQAGPGVWRRGPGIRPLHLGR